MVYFSAKYSTWVTVIFVDLNVIKDPERKYVVFLQTKFSIGTDWLAKKKKKKLNSTILIQPKYILTA
jgi:hypothetical protein